jgi:hypothetical protein
MAALETYSGRCHCGAVRFEADLDLTQPSYRCNCTICRRTRFWPAVARPAHFRLAPGADDALSRYTFGGGRNEHWFCRHCGVRTHGVGNDTPIGAMVGVNLGCLEGVDDAMLAAIPVVRVDGLHDRPDRSPAHGGFL